MVTSDIFFFDVDGTLVDPLTHSVPDSTRYALQELKNNGQLICICTGRSLDALEDAGFDSIAKWDYYICCNGQISYDKHKQCIHRTPIPHDIVASCIAKADALHAPLLLQGEKTILTKEANAHVKAAAAFFNEAIPPHSTYDDFDVYMMIAYGEVGYDYHDYNDLKALQFIPGQSSYADVVLKGMNKYTGIKALLKQLNISDYIAFGDSMNDLEMLAHAKIAVVLGNGCFEAKQIADIVTECVCEHGIYHALVQMKQIKPHESFERRTIYE